MNPGTSERPICFTRKLMKEWFLSQLYTPVVPSLFVSAAENRSKKVLLVACEPLCEKRINAKNAKPTSNEALFICLILSPEELRLIKLSDKISRDSKSP